MPISKIISRLTRSLVNCKVAVSIVVRAYAYDNSVDNVSPQLVFRTSEGKLIRHYGDIYPWALEILREIDSEFAPWHLKKSHAACGWASQAGMKRFFDLILGLFTSVVLLLPVLLVAIAVRLTSKGPALYWSDRVGRNNVVFNMPKFRSMRVGTPAVATHLLTDARSHLTPIGSFLRKSSLDELPQLWSIFAGDMSFVGPRPALFNQHDLIALRKQHGVHELVPGLTGWAQVNGRDELPIPDKVKLDAEYLTSHGFWFDIKILWMTFLKVIQRDGVLH